MTFNDWASIATIFQTIFIAISIGLIWYQLREAVRLTRAANSQRLQELLGPWQLQLAQDEKLAELWLQGSRTPDAMNEIDQWRYHRLLMYVLNVTEDAHHQWHEKLFDDVTYRRWNEGLNDIIALDSFEHHWNIVKKSFEPSFVQYVDQQLKKVATPSTRS